MDSVTIRETFLAFFQAREHRRYESFSLIPNDPTLLLTAAGMVPFKPFFLGDAIPESPRATSFQKSARTTDIENVGRTSRHLTFFEMLGNFSFGDYFKREAIVWAWELATGPFAIDPSRVWVTVHVDDADAADLWEAETDVPRSRIQALGADNFWDMGVAGPCGPCTELHYDRGPEYGSEGGPSVDGDRYLEFYNLVFMQFLRDDAGAITGTLPKQNVDTGMGLERMAMLLQDVATIFETDMLAPMVTRAQELTGRQYGESADADVSLRVVAEHARTAAFLIADGVLPAKDGRGYVLRRLLRRAIRHARLLGTETPVLDAMTDVVVATMHHGYPDLDRQHDLITRVVVAEEAEFARTLRQGLGLLDEAVAATRASGAGALPAETAFKLHDTYGFPIDLTAEIAEEAGVAIDREEFERLMDEQRTRARAAVRRGGDGVPIEILRDVVGESGRTEFVGYDTLTADAAVAALVTPGGRLDAASEGDELEVVLTRTSFYPEGGGQVGDSGVIETPSGRLRVLDTLSPLDGLVVHRARVEAGEVRPGQDAVARVDGDRRRATARSHSATHVLHATVRGLLGTHAQQAGSLVDAGRLRFDFPHFEQVSRSMLAEVEESVNARALSDPPVVTEVLPIDQARASGAIALFGEKYGDTVRVVSIGDFSRELCGGTHVGSAAEIGAIAVVREESIGANLRRIEAVTGLDAYRYLARERMIADELARLLHTRTDDAIARVTGLLERLRVADRELDRHRAATLSTQAHTLAGTADLVDVPAVAGGRVGIVGHQVDAHGDDLRRLAVDVRGSMAVPAVVILGRGAAGEPAQLVAVASPEAAAAGADARTVLGAAAAVVGGGAGGTAELAQAGGRDGAQVAAALVAGVAEARRLLVG